MTTSNLPNLVRNEVELRQKRARLDSRINSLIWTMENNPLANGATIFAKIDTLRIQVKDLSTAIQSHEDAAERRQLRRELLSA